MHTNSSIIPSTHTLCRTVERAGQRCHRFPSHILHQPCKGEPGHRELQESSHAAPSPSQHSRRCSSKSSTIIQYCGSMHWYAPPLTPQEQPTAERHHKGWAWGTVKGSHILLNSGSTLVKIKMCTEVVVTSHITTHPGLFILGEQLHAHCYTSGGLCCYHHQVCHISIFRNILFFPYMNLNRFNTGA